MTTSIFAADRSSIKSLEVVAAISIVVNEGRPAVSVIGRNGTLSFVKVCMKELDVILVGIVMSARATLVRKTTNAPTISLCDRRLPEIVRRLFMNTSM